MLQVIGSFLDSTGLTPHGVCLLWRPELLWLHVTSDSAIALSYDVIPVALVTLVWQRRDLVFSWVFWLFAGFILACSVTHWLDVWTLWHPDYLTQGLVKAVTALLSVATACAVWPLLPKALALPSPSRLAEANRQLEQQVEERRKAELALRDLNESLEQRVAERTHNLTLVNQRLQAEIEDRIRAEEALRGAETQLRQSQKMEAVGNLTGGLAHDFNNLLAVIIGDLDMLAERLQGDAGSRELALEALDSALRGAELTRRLLAFARRQPLQPQRIDVSRLVDGIAHLLRRTLGEDIQIFLDLSHDVWPVVADPAQLEASLTNLATNARDAMPRGGRLMIAVGNRTLDQDYAGQHPDATPGDYVLIEVTDTGTGIAPDIIGKIFEPFFTTKEVGRGTGLGLSMVFGFMRQSGGHINVDSNEGIGTTIRLYLPRAADISASVEAPPEIDKARSGHETVLVVEDNELMRRVVERQLKDLGYAVIEAENADRALELLATNPRIAILFSDIVMPGRIDGAELARLAQERWPHLAIVLTSGFPQARLKPDGDTPLGIRLLSKPYRKEDLARILAEAVDAKDASR
jgi:signal transduction histidine kinase/ActR/RegA family two-component response regulator